MQWGDWVAAHAALFGFGLAGGAEHETTMLAEWSALFARGGYAPADAYDATQRLALGDTPRWPREHLAALLHLLRAARRAAVGRDSVVDSPPAGCLLCEDHGLAAGLPSRLALSRGYRGYETVCCSCARGRQRSQALAERRPPTIDSYEIDCPDWREILETWRQTDLAERRALGAAADLGRVVGRIIRQLKERGAT